MSPQNRTLAKAKILRVISAYFPTHAATMANPKLRTKFITKHSSMPAKELQALYDAYDAQPEVTA